MLDFNLLLIVTAVWGACWLFVYPVIRRVGQAWALSIGAIWGLAAATIVVLGAETIGGRAFFGIVMGLPMLIASVGLVYLAHYLEQGIPPARRRWSLAHTAFATAGGIGIILLLCVIYAVNVVIGR